ncbi:MarR family winged helix-turn-helix transcriptional regulator [Streptosporangium subroseum]|uniref:MarR family winged helix-turn-helix transcriptional regulator n=1 Tax=Streptosporangium subroseum TaxID=106412 RepID=UPI003414AC95
MTEIGIMLHRVVAGLDRAGDRVLRAELGISHSRAVLLLVLDRQGPISQRELAAELGCTDPAVTGLLREVSRSGFTEVTPDPANRRRNVVSLTPSGRAIVQTASALLDQRFANLLALSHVNGEELLSILTRLDRNLTTPRRY